MRLLCILGRVQIEKRNEPFVYYKTLLSARVKRYGYNLKTSDENCVQDADHVSEINFLYVFFFWKNSGVRRQNCEYKSLVRQRNEERVSVVE